MLKEFNELGETQRTLIVRHLELFLDGPIEDQMWHHALTRAKLEQMAKGRADRVWKFFEPAPAEPRVRPPQPVDVPFAVWAQAVAATVVFVIATLHIGYLLAQAGQVIELLTYLLSVIGGYFGARNGAEWRFRTVHRHAKDMEYGTLQHRSSAPAGGFASKVDERFGYYFAKYVPHGANRDIWLARTAGIRNSLRNEIVDAYRETRTGSEEIHWLIRHRVQDVRDQWRKGTLWNYREELATPLVTKAATIFGVVALMAGGIWAASGAVQAVPLSAVRSMALVLASGWIAARAWLHITLERRRYTTDEREADQRLEKSWEAFGKWKEKLADKPDDLEISAWLDCDRKVLLDEALQHYKLTMSNVVAHAFIEAPASSAKRARVRGGPWRYKKYQLLVFLLTEDGVRQLTVTLDFERGTFHDRQRTNYRFEAVAAVRVNQADNDERTFDLALIDGQKISVQVTGPGMEELQQDEQPGTVSEVTLDASGIHHTLHVLEGVAAEGKEWISRERGRGEERAGKFAAVMKNSES
ncbi:hypothetical protein GCM10010156_57400 [Planobispora rosea]|uniref:Uncharacterized protein n=1 Tax=Planobispora rosea TaxID=35762 RepID=A0A8J3SC35_PLARO|nr:hypothetical protein [Planobispora rosea]GGS91643.1 hypothetical protein GCM10010156_57400 [Planobispora rosea]GIH87043.1 hypothetical protein Pro02_54510 [Planobispora rosea]